MEVKTCVGEPGKRVGHLTYCSGNSDIELWEAKPALGSTENELDNSHNALGHSKNELWKAKLALVDRKMSNIAEIEAQG
ncbi:hypothetical protein GGD38_000444 [Chitinophagaceae bacterium OAS944]|nr:hypothetical protein [Chitinophagaceae bacterium OAS944]